MLKTTYRGQPLPRGHVHGEPEEPGVVVPPLPEGVDGAPRVRLIHRLVEEPAEHAELEDEGADAGGAALLDAVLGDAVDEVDAGVREAGVGHEGREEAVREVLGQGQELTLVPRNRVVGVTERYRRFKKKFRGTVKQKFNRTPKSLRERKF